MRSHIFPEEGMECAKKVVGDRVGGEGEGFGPPSRPDGLQEVVGSYDVLLEADFRGCNSETRHYQASFSEF